MKKSKMQGVAIASDYRPTSSMSLEGKHAAATKNAKVGSKAKFIVTATKKRHSMNSDSSHSAGFDIDNVQVHQDSDDYSGPNNKESNNQKNGGKIA